MKYIMTGIAAAVLAAGTAQAQLTDAQMGQLEKVEQGFTQEAAVFQGLIESKLMELAAELQREGRLATEEAAAEASANVNAILKDLSALYGDFIKTKVEYVLKAKNTLTDEQKMALMAELQPNASLPYETVIFMQPETFDSPLNLSLEQRKKIVELETALLSKEVEIEGKVEMILLEIEEVLLSGEPQPERVDPLVMKLADLAGKAIDNRVSFFIKAKDVLTLDQKRMLAELLGLE